MQNLAFPRATTRSERAVGDSTNAPSRASFSVEGMPARGTPQCEIDRLKVAVALHTTALPTFSTAAVPEAAYVQG